MQKYRSLIYPAVLALFFIVVCPVCALDYSVSGDMSHMTDDAMLRWNTGISDDYIIWVEEFGQGQAVYLCNAESGAKSLVSFSMYSDYLPSVSGEKIVWSERRGYNTPSQVVLYNISSGRYSYADSYPANQGMPDVSGDYVVWLDGRYYGFTNIYLKDTATGREGLFRESRTGDKKSPQFDGDYIYWIEKGVLYKKSISGGEPETVAEGVSGDFSVSGGRAVWEELSGEYYSVVLFDGEINERTTISVPCCDLRNPYISGNAVVYEKHDSFGSDIFLYDLSTKTAAAVYRGSGYQINPKISGENIIWTDSKSGGCGIVLFCADVSAKPDGEFSADASSVLDGLGPLDVRFRGSSTVTLGSATSYLWDFGDGTTSTDGSPVHTYTEPGKYNVSLKVSNDFGSDVFTRAGYVTVGELPAVDFTAEGTKGIFPYTTRFHEVSSGDIDSRIWDFGDGTGSVLRNPYHIFRNAGSYTVSLTVKNRYGEVTETKENLVDVGGAPEAAFVYSYDESGTETRPVVRFSDASSADPDSWLWYFGDGTFSTEQNPVHTFEEAGIYDISLKVSNSYGEDIKTEENIILAKLSENPPDEIIIVPNEAGLVPGETMQFVAAGRDSTGQTRIIYPEWSVLNETVAEMGFSGVLRAKEYGRTEVVCEYMGTRAHAYVAVGSESYARSGRLPALVLSDTPDKLSEDARELVRIFYINSGQN